MATGCSPSFYQANFTPYSTEPASRPGVISLPRYEIRICLQLGVFMTSNIARFNGLLKGLSEDKNGAAAGKRRKRDERRNDGTGPRRGEQLV